MRRLKYVAAKVKANIPSNEPTSWRKVYGALQLEDCAWEELFHQLPIERHDVLALAALLDQLDQVPGALLQLQPLESLLVVEVVLLNEPVEVLHQRLNGDRRDLPAVLTDLSDLSDDIGRQLGLDARNGGVGR